MITALLIMFIVAVVVMVKVLHTTYIYSAGATGAGTEDTLATSAYSPTGDNEIQLRFKPETLPTWIGIHTANNDAARAGATTMTNYMKFEMNTWTKAQEYKIAPHITAPHATPDVIAQWRGPDWFPEPGWDVTRDADWTTKIMTTTASAPVAACLYLSYGPKLPYRGGKIITRTVEFSADGGVGTAFAGGQSITDLDPRLVYRYAGAQLANIENHDNMALRVSSPSNSTSVVTLHPSFTDTTYHGFVHPVYLPHDSILINGVETVQIDGSVVAAGKPSYTLFFEEYGASGIKGTTRASINTGKQSLQKIADGLGKITSMG